MTKREKGRIGQSFEDFLQEQGRLEESTQQAVKRVIAYQLLAAMEDQNLTRTALAEKLQTSRSQINRLLDPENAGVTLEALSRAAHAVGRELQLELR
ncbi:MAG: XRE family transcriptional regulator [Planctomycetaceae bacterium]|nr:XRE family transcriptional regulator [Planctomycetaceae bacterium]